MQNSGQSEESLRDPAATKALQDLTGRLREALLAEAKNLAGDGPITEDEIAKAFQRLQYPSKESLEFADAQAVISQALRENRAIEWVSYGMGIVLFVFGIVLLSIGAATKEPDIRLGSLASGTIVELLILVPFRFAINSRRHNIALRMLGIILSRVDDPEKLAPLLKDTFLSVVLGDASFNFSRKE